MPEYIVDSEGAFTDSCYYANEDDPTTEPFTHYYKMAYEERVMTHLNERGSQGWRLVSTYWREDARELSMVFERDS